MREYGLDGNMHFRFLHLIKQVLKSTRHTTGGRCSVSAQASGAESAVLSHAGRRDASPTPSRGSAAGSAVVPDGPLPSSTGVMPVIVPTGGRCSVSAQASGAASAVIGLEGGFAASHGRRRRAIPTQEFSMGADAPWCGSTSRSAHGRDAAPSGSQASGAESAVTRHQLPATRHSRFAALTCPTLSTILHPHEHGQNPFDPRSRRIRASSSPRDRGMFGVGRRGMPDSGLGTRASFISKSCYEGNLQRLLVIAERIQGQDHPVDVYSLDRTVHLRFRRYQVPLTPVAAVCDRRPAGNAVVPDGPLPCSTGVVRLWSAKPTPPGPPVIVPTGGHCSVSAHASGDASAVPGLEGGFAASHGRRRRAIPTQEFSMGAVAPWCGSTCRSARGRVGSPQRTQIPGAESAVLSAFSSLTRHSRAAASYHE